MAVKFSEFTPIQDASDANALTQIVGFATPNELNVKIPPANLDTTYAVSTGNAGASPTISIQGTKPGQVATINPSTVSLTGSGATLLAGNGSTTIDFASTAYAITSTDTSPAGTVPLVLTGTGGGDAGTDTVNLVGAGGIGITSSSNTVTITGSGGGGVTSFTNTNGTFVSAATANSAATGAVTTGVIDLSATGTPSASNFLRGDNTWAAPTDVANTYTLPITGSSAAVTATLTGSAGDTDPVVITAGNDIDFSNITTGGFTIDSSASGDTYSLTAGGKVGSNVPLNLNALAGSDSVVNLTQGTGITLTQNSTTQITIDAAVVSVDEKAAGVSSGTPIIVDPTTGAVEVQSMAYAGQANVGHVPAGGSAGKYLDGDTGAWITLPSTLSIDKQTFTGNGTLTDFTLTTAAGCTADNLNIYISGVYQNSVDASNAVNYTVTSGLNPTLQFVSGGTPTAPPVTATRGIEVVITR